MPYAPTEDEVAVAVERLRALLPAAIADEPAAQGFLRGSLDPYARLCGYLDSRAADLPTLYDPAAVPAGQVRDLAQLVGLGSDLPAVAGLNARQLRRLIPVIVRIWKRKGTAGSWRDMIGALTGKRVLILDFFALRTTDGATAELYVLPAVGEDDGSSYGFPENVSDVWVADPDQELNLSATGDGARLIGLVRPSGERINLARALLVEDLRVGAVQWTAAPVGTPGTGYSADADGAPGIVAPAGVALVQAVAPPAVDLSVYVLLAVRGRADLLVCLQAADAEDGYRLRIDLAAETATLARVVGGVATDVATWATGPLQADVDYEWRIEVHHRTDATEIAARLAGDVLGEFADTDGARHGAGRFGFAAVAGGSRRAILRQALIVEQGVSRARIGPG